MFHIDGGNNGVGIGTTGTTTPLTINGGTATAATIQLGNHGDNAAIHAKYNLQFKADSTEAISGRGIGFAIGTVPSFALTTSEAIFNDTGADLDFRIESSGNANMLKVDGGTNRVGVGVVPTNVFEVKSAGDGADQITLQHSGNTVDLVSLGQDGGHGSLVLRQNSSAVGVYLSATGGAIFNENSLDVDFRVESDNQTHALFVEGSSGNVLVGTASNASGQRLHIESAAQFGQIGLRHSSATAGQFWYVGPASNNTFAIYNQSPAGVYLANGATSWTGASDENSKENIVELTGALDKVKDFRCVEYNLIADETNSKKIGFIAQDWQEDYSQVVSQDPDGNLGIQYTETIPVLLKAIQEQQTLIESLTDRIAALEE
jgi:hypothetical protein